MRVNSAKQKEASRKNGARSKGPTTDPGKQKVKRNAIKDALYAKDVVVEESGESIDEFNQFRKELLEIFNPAPIAEVFFNDFVENWWRRQRVRRAEALSLRWDSASLQHEMTRINDIERCSSRFFDVLARMLAVEKVEPSTLAQLEEYRIQLSSSSLGLFRLQQLLEETEQNVRQTGKLSRRTLNMLVACLGFASDLTTACVNLGGLEESAKGTTETGHHGYSPNRSGPEANDKQNAARVGKVTAQAKQSGSEETQSTNRESDRADELLNRIRLAILMLERKRQLVKEIEKRETKVRQAAASIGADSQSDRYSRAETIYERRMHRAFMLYVAAQKIAGASYKTPGLPVGSPL